MLEKTEHILIVEKGAQKFALDHEIPILPPSSLREISSLISFKSISESFEYEQEECEIEELKNEKNEKNENNEKKNVIQVVLYIDMEKAKYILMNYMMMI